MDSKEGLIRFWRMNPSVPIKSGGLDTTHVSQSA